MQIHGSSTSECSYMMITRMIYGVSDNLMIILMMMINSERKRKNNKKKEQIAETMLVTILVQRARRSLCRHE